MISSEDYVRRGHQIDLDFANLDTVIQSLSKGGAAPFADVQTWNAVKADWGTFYHENIESTPILPVQAEGTLDDWSAKVAAWRAKSDAWAKASSDTKLKAIAAANPKSPAALTHEEAVATGKKGAPTWVWAGIGLGSLLSLGYVLSSAARLRGR